MNTIKQLYILILILFAGFVSNGQTNENNTYQKAISEYAQNHFEKATAVLNSDNLSSENDAMFLILKGDSYFALNNFKDALSAYLKK